MCIWVEGNLQAWRVVPTWSCPKAPPGYADRLGSQPRGGDGNQDEEPQGTSPEEELLEWGRAWPGSRGVMFLAEPQSQGKMASSLQQVPLGRGSSPSPPSSRPVQCREAFPKTSLPSGVPDWLSPDFHQTSFLSANIEVSDCSLSSEFYRCTWSRRCHTQHFFLRKRALIRAGINCKEPGQV